MAAAPGGVVHVSLHQYSEAVALDPLPGDADDVVELLSAEAAPIPVWLDAAKAFLAQGNVGVTGVLPLLVSPRRPAGRATAQQTLLQWCAFRAASSKVSLNSLPLCSVVLVYVLRWPPARLCWVTPSPQT